MPLNKYCFCYELGVGSTLIGFLQLNAMFFFFARFAELEPIYCWLDLGVAVCYTIRVTMFFVMIGMDYSVESRYNYYDTHVWTIIPLMGTGIAITVCKWLEFGHVPTWTLVSWLLVLGFNIYNLFGLKEWAELALFED